MDSPGEERTDGLRENVHNAGSGEQPRLERLPSVRARTGLSKTTIWRLVTRFDFPAPIRLGPSTVAWVSKEIDQWIAERIAASRGGAK